MFHVLSMTLNCSLTYALTIMFGFSIEFKPWYIVIRGPRGRVYLATGFAKKMPVFTPIGTFNLDEYTYSHLSVDDDYQDEEEEEDDYQDEEEEDEEEELLLQLKDIR